MKLRYFLFGDYSKTRPLVAFVGEEGSTKTTSLRMVGIANEGEFFDVTPLPKEQADFDVVAADHYYIVVDNADTSCRWLNDRLAVISTGGVFEKRKLYSDDDVFKITPQCFVYLTSRTPKFRRADVADRTLIFRTKKPERFVLERNIYRDVITNRNAIANFSFNQAQNTIKALRATENEGQIIPIHVRLADFADFCLRIAQYEGFENEMADILSNMTDVQADFVLEEDPLVELLSIWVEENANREVTANKLHGELKALASEHDLSMSYPSPNSLAKRLHNARNQLGKQFEITTRSGHAGVLYYTFRERNTGGVGGVQRSCFPEH